MPIVITPWSPDLSVGPGLTVRLQSDFIGPLQQGSYWDITLDIAAPSEGSILRQQKQTMVTDDNYVVADPNEGEVSWTGTGAARGSAIQVQVYLNDPNGNALDYGITDANQVVWDPDSGIARRQEQLPAGGLTDAEGQQLDKVEQAVILDQQPTTIAPFQAITTGALLNTPIGALIAHPDIHLLDFYEPFQLQGRGIKAHGVDVNLLRTYGITFEISQSPAGLGRRDGFVVEYVERIVQFVTQYAVRSGGIAYTFDVQDFHEDNMTYMWSHPAPQQIGYDVSPGVILTCRWLVVF